MQLHAAAARGDLTGINFALSQGTDIDAHDAGGRTALINALETAAAFRHKQGPKVTLDAVGLLLKAGARLDAIDSLGQTAIHHAVRIADFAFVEMLLEQGSDPLYETPSGYTVLLHACYQPSSKVKVTIIERLVAAGADPNKASNYGEFPLSVCLHFGDFAALNRLIELGADPSPLEWTPLHKAVGLGSLSEVNQLAQSPTAINFMNPRFALSPWMLAIKRGNLPMTQLLVERGADLKKLGRRGVSALHFAAEFGRKDVIAYLLENGADVRAADEFGTTPLHEAATWDHFECVQELIHAGAEVASVDHVTSQPIHKTHSVKMLELLKNAGADVNAIDGCGEWPLKLAAEDNDAARIEWLLRQGADVDRTSTGDTALHAAVSADAREAAERLLKAGANPNAQDVDGWTPLCGACSCEVIRMLLEAGADPKLTDQANGEPEQWLIDPILKAALRAK